MSLTGNGPATAATMPRPYLAWLAAAGLSLLGTSGLYFALGWAASAHGGRLAGVVLAVIVTGRILLALIGGATADRYGARRSMIAGDAVMLAATLALALAAAGWGTPAWLLLTTAAVVGAVEAFYLPASGSMPRRLVDPVVLPRAMAARQIVGQGANLAGGPAAAVLLASGGLVAVALADAASFAVMLVVLVLLRTAVADRDGDAGDAGDAGDGGGAAAAATASLIRRAADGFGVAVRDPVLRTLLALVAMAAGTLLPVTSLLVPLLVRERSWGVATAGLLVALAGLGTGAVAVLVLWRGNLGPPRPLTAAGLLLAGIAVLGLGLSEGRPAAAVAAAATGLGTGLFTTHAAPLLLGAAPPGHLSRVQAVLLLVQSVPLLAANLALGWLVDATSAAATVTACGGVLGLTGLVALAGPRLRRATDER